MAQHALRLPDDLMASLDALAETIGQPSRNAYLVDILRHHVDAATDHTPVADQSTMLDQYPEKAAPGRQIWIEGGLKAELQGLANKRGVDLASLLAGCADLERDMRPSPRPRPLTALPKAIDQAAGPRRRGG